MEVLVTGANGFIGSALCRRLVENGYNVKGLVRKTSDLSRIKGLPIQLIFGSLEDQESLINAAEGEQIVFHLAATTTDWGSKEFFHRVNVEGTHRLIEASVNAGVNRFVYVSSFGVHSFINSENMNEESPTIPPPFHYCQTKLDAENLVMKYHQQRKINVTVVRPGVVFGPGNTDFFHTKALKSGKTIYFGDGRILNPYLYIDNLIDGLILAGTKDEASGEIYVITDGTKITQRNFNEMICKEMGITPSSISINSELAYAVAWFLETIYHFFRIQNRPFITRFHVSFARNNYHFNIEKARRDLGYVPRISIDEAIRRTVDWYRKETQNK